MPISSYEDMKEKKSQIMCSLYDVAGIVDYNGSVVKTKI